MGLRQMNVAFFSSEEFKGCLELSNQDKKYFSAQNWKKKKKDLKWIKYQSFK